MTETPPPVPVLPPQLPVTLPFEDAVESSRRQGCLKWGLVGCAGASVAVIVGLLFLMSNVKQIMGFAFDKLGDQVVTACGPDVSPAQREDFRAALKSFVEKTKAGTVTAQQVAAFQKKVTTAVADNRVTSEELQALTTFLRNPQN